MHWVAGVYAGDPYKLSVSQAFPKLGQIEARYGSLIKGQIFWRARNGKRGRECELASRRTGRRSISLTRAVQVLPDTLPRAAWRGGSPGRQCDWAHGRPAPGAGRSGARQTAGSCAPSTRRRSLYAGTALSAGRDGDTGAGAAEFRAVCRDSLPAGGPAWCWVSARRDVAHPCQGFRHVDPRIEGFKNPGCAISLRRSFRTARRPGI